MNAGQQRRICERGRGHPPQDESSPGDEIIDDRANERSARRIFRPDPVTAGIGDKEEIADDGNEAAESWLTVHFDTIRGW